MRIILDLFLRHADGSNTMDRSIGGSNFYQLQHILTVPSSLSQRSSTV